VVVAADIPCLTPLVWITKPPNGMSFKKADPVVINGEARINCTLAGNVTVE
jgi:hypothetical protein